MKFGDIVYITKDNNEGRNISPLPIGTKCVVIKEVNLPAYDLLVAPENYALNVVDANGVAQEHRTVYLIRGSWKNVVSDEKTDVINSIINIVRGIMSMYEHQWPDDEKIKLCEICELQVEKGTPCRSSRYFNTWLDLDQLLEQVRNI